MRINVGMDIGLHRPGGYPRAIRAATELALEIRLLVGRRRDLVHGRTQRLSRPRDLLVGIFPVLERSLDLTTKGPPRPPTKFVTPAEPCAAGKKRLVRHLQAAGGPPKVDGLATRVLAVAAERSIAVPAERMTARLTREMASPPSARSGTKTPAPSTNGNDARKNATIGPPCPRLTRA